MRASGEGTIFYHEPSKRWRAAITVKRDGKSVRVERYADTQKEAVRLLRALHAQHRAGLFKHNPDRITVESHIQWWLDTVAAPNFRYTSWRYYRGLARNYIFPHVGTYRLLDLEPQHIEQFLLTLNTKGGGPASPRLRQQIFDFLRKVLKNAYRRRYVEHNVCDMVYRPRIPKPDIWPLDELQAKALVDAAKGHRLHAFFHLAVNTGMRFGELAALQWQDIDLETARIAVQRGLVPALVKDPAGVVKEKLILAETKSRRGRSVPVPQYVVDVLEGHRRRMEDEGHLDFVFCDKRGGPLRASNLTRRFWRELLAMANASLPPGKKMPSRLRFHDLRHTHATMLLKEGVHAKIVSERLGHAKISTTIDQYSHVLPSMQQPAVDALNRLFGDETK